MELYIRKRAVSSDMVTDAAKRASGKLELTRPSKPTPYPSKKWYHRLLGERWFINNIETPWRALEDFRLITHDRDNRLLQSAYTRGYMQGYSDSDQLDFVHMRHTCNECGTVLIDSRNFIKVYVEPSVLDMLDVLAQNLARTTPPCGCPVEKEKEEKVES